MWTCRRCGKPVYFAERRQSIGFDWHRECLKCQECGKVLNPGQHAEHKETPYCHVPCYSALFGPKLFGHGSQVESHQSFGKRSGQKLLLQQQELEKRMREYNDYHSKQIQNHQTHSLDYSINNQTRKSQIIVQKDDSLSNSYNNVTRNPSFVQNGGKSRLEVTSREVNGRLVLEGVLRICWGVEHSIRIKEFDDKRLIAKRSNSDSENANCDKKSSKVVVSDESSSVPGFTSLEYSFNGEIKETDDKSREVVRRDGRKSIAFQRHSVHQINLSKKDINFEAEIDHIRSPDEINENDINHSNTPQESHDNANIVKDHSYEKNVVTSKLFNSSFSSPSQSLKKGGISHMTISEQDSDSATLTSKDQKELQEASAAYNVTSSFKENDKQDRSISKATVGWRKIEKSQGKVERRSSDVTLEKIRAGDRRENETICASLKRYQTLPPNVALDSLPGFSEYRLHRYAPLSDLATLKSTSSSGSSHYLRSSTSDSMNSNHSSSKLSSTIKTFISCEDDLNNDDEDNKEIELSENKDPIMEDIDSNDKSDNFLKPDVKAIRGTGPRALRRRPGRKFSEKRKATLKRQSSFNGHWYDRDTSVFTPPKDSYMSVWTTSLTRTPEVVKMLMEKYQIQIDNSDRFALFVVKDNGERRRLTDSECPLLTRVNLGPHEDASKIYVMDNRTTDIRHEVAQYLRFSYAELRAILNMFYEEEEGEIKRIQQKYKLVKDIMEKRAECLRQSQEE